MSSRGPCSHGVFCYNEPLEVWDLATLLQGLSCSFAPGKGSRCSPGMVEVEGTVLCLATVAAYD